MLVVVVAVAVAVVVAFILCVACNHSYIAENALLEAIVLWK